MKTCTKFQHPMNKIRALLYDSHTQEVTEHQISKNFLEDAYRLINSDIVQLVSTQTLGDLLCDEEYNIRPILEPEFTMVERTDLWIGGNILFLGPVDDDGYSTDCNLDPLVLLRGLQAVGPEASRRYFERFQ